MGRLYGKILREKTEQQAHFTTGSSHVDHVYTLEQLLERKNKTGNKDIFMVLVDLKKSQDLEPRSRKQFTK